MSATLPAFVVGWKISVGIAILILLHEMGHWLMARRLGLDLGLPVLVPFLGGFVRIDADLLNHSERALIALAGPAVGLLGDVLITLSGRFVSDGTLVTLGTVGILFNLLNLIPVLPFDGGWSAAVIDRRLWLAGFAASIALVVSGLVEWWSLLFVALGTFQMHSLNAERNDDREPSRRSSFRQRVIIGGIHTTLMLLPLTIVWLALPVVWAQIH